jgi:Ca2+-binding EF-hand superfamily protein
MFKYFDTFDRGNVSFSDFMRTLEKIGLYYTAQDMLPLFEQVYDVDGNGALDYKEFSAIVFGNHEGLKGQ